MTLVRILIPSILLTFAACNSGSFQSYTQEDIPPNDGFETPEMEMDGSGRVTSGLQALYLFNEGVGATVLDRSGHVPAANLKIDNPAAITWMEGGGLNVVSPTIITSEAPITRVGQTCMASNEITFEAWVRPASVIQQGPARIFTYSDGNNNANFMLGQSESEAEVRLRTTATEPNGNPATVSETTPFNGALVHLAYTRNGIDDVATLYVGGQYAAEQAIAGNFSEWDMEYYLSLANEIGEQRPWRGEIYLAAVYCRSLTPAEIFENFSAGIN